MLRRRGAGGHRRIIGKHLLVNCIGPLIVTTTLQIPSAIFTESFLSFIGIMFRLYAQPGIMAADAIGVYIPIPTGFCARYNDKPYYPFL